MKIWIRGAQRDGAVSNTMKAVADRRLLQLKSCVPCDFSRKPRSLRELEHSKATEYRQFVLYTGGYVLQGVLTADQYKNFMALSVACCILVSRDLARNPEYLNYA